MEIREVGVYIVHMRPREGNCHFVTRGCDTTELFKNPPYFVP